MKPFPLSTEENSHRTNKWKFVLKFDSIVTLEPLLIDHYTDKIHNIGMQTLFQNADNEPGNIRF